MESVQGVCRRGQKKNLKITVDLKSEKSRSLEERSFLPGRKLKTVQEEPRLLLAVAWDTNFLQRLSVDTDPSLPSLLLLLRFH